MTDRWAPLFFDPLALVYSAGAADVTGAFSFDAVGLCQSDLDDALVLEVASPGGTPPGRSWPGWSFRWGAVDGARDLLAGLDANTIGPYRRSRSDLLARVSGDEDVSVGLSTERLGPVLRAPQLRGPHPGARRSSARAPDRPRRPP